jgi:hypothetical protein
MHQLCVLQSGKVDFYGNSIRWVPRVAFGEYRNFLTNAMNVFNSLESSYINYHAALDVQQSVNDAVKTAKSEIDGALADIAQERTVLVQKLIDLDHKIELAGIIVEEKHTMFQKEYEKFKAEIEATHVAPPVGEVSIFA